MKLNMPMLTGRIDAIRTALSRLKDLNKLSEEDFLEDYKNPASAETFLRHCLEGIFDIGRHLLAKSSKFRLIHEYKDIARGLSEIGIISKPLTQKLMEMAGYRNRIVHFYHEITDAELYQILQNDLKDIESFLEEIGRFLREQNNK